MERKLTARKGNFTDEELLMPAYKIYKHLDPDINIEDKIESHQMSQHLHEQYATYKDFDLDMIPDEWAMGRVNAEVGRQRFDGKCYWEGLGYEEQKERDEEYEMLLEKMRQKELLKESTNKE